MLSGHSMECFGCLHIWCMQREHKQQCYLINDSATSATSGVMNLDSAGPSAMELQEELESDHECRQQHSQ